MTATKLRGEPVCWSSQDAGASPLFPPKHDSVETAVPQLQGIVQRSPQLYDLPASCWTLERLQQVVDWLKPLSRPGVCKLLKRFRVSYKRGRRHVHSPDLDYDKKLALIRQAEQLVRQDPDSYVLLYQDELTYYQRPRVAYAYAAKGSKGRKARQGTAGSAYYRIAACLDVRSGAVIARQRSSFNVKGFKSFLRQVEKHYPKAKTIYIALDNWPVHFHESILEALKTSRIQLLRLPTYAPWTNPVEKLWLKLCQDVLDFHELAQDWQGLKQAVACWLDRWKQGSTDLLRFVGLSPT